MTREEAREFLLSIANQLGCIGVENLTDRDSDRMRDAIKALEEPHWIPVVERLPENGEIVLATHLGGLDQHRQVIEHIYDHGEFLLNWEMDMDMLSPTFGQRYMGEVIAWMPLPEPWRGDAE